MPFAVIEIYTPIFVMVAICPIPICVISSASVFPLLLHANFNRSRRYSPSGAILIALSESSISSEQVEQSRVAEKENVDILCHLFPGGGRERERELPKLRMLFLFTSLMFEKAL